MKKYLSWLWVLFMLNASSLLSQNNWPEITVGNYIVVGAYKKGDEKLISSFLESLKGKSLNVNVAFESARGFYYVYLDSPLDFDAAIRKMQQTRQTPGLENAWVRAMTTNNAATTTTATEVKESTMLIAQSKETAPTPAQENKAIESNVEKSIENPVPKIDSVKATEIIDNPPATSGAFYPETLINTDVFLSIFEPRKNIAIQGEIEVVDTERARLITKVKGNEYIKLPDPKSKSGQLSLICNIFGYRKVQREISFPTPIQDEQAELFGNFFVVPFEMIRYQRGDIYTLYKVYFYNDAAVMLPESKYELNSLLNMMNENPKYKIVLHGHSNGNARGKIIMMGPSKDFFSLTKDVKVNANGSAKELSNQRALTIREWLISNGVAPDRVSVKPWGGKRMIHDKMGVNAKKNIRVEVEVLED